MIRECASVLRYTYFVCLVCSKNSHHIGYELLFLLFEFMEITTSNVYDLLCLTNLMRKLEFSCRFVRKLLLSAKIFFSAKFGITTNAMPSLVCGVTDPH